MKETTRINKIQAKREQNKLHGQPSLEKESNKQSKITSTKIFEQDYIKDSNKLKDKLEVNNKNHFYKLSIEERKIINKNEQNKNIKLKDNNILIGIKKEINSSKETQKERKIETIFNKGKSENKSNLINSVSNRPNTKLIANENQINRRKTNNLNNKGESYKNNQNAIISKDNNFFNNISIHIINATKKEQKKEITVQKRHLTIIKPFNNQNNDDTKNNFGKNQQYNRNTNYLRKNIINNKELQKIINTSTSRYNKPSILSKQEQNQMSLKTSIAANIETKYQTNPQKPCSILYKKD